MSFVIATVLTNKLKCLSVCVHEIILAGDLFRCQLEMSVIGYADSLYHFYLNGEAASASQAKSLCFENGGHLVDLKSPIEKLLLREVISNALEKTGKIEVDQNLVQPL